MQKLAPNSFPSDVARNPSPNTFPSDAARNAPPNSLSSDVLAPESESNITLLF